MSDQWTEDQRKLGQTADKLLTACGIYCKWYQEGIPGMDGGSMAYELVSFIRLALEKLPNVKLPIGVKDKNGRDVRLGDRVRFDESEFGAPCEFTIEIRDGEIVYPGAPDDFPQFCEVIE